MKILIADDSKPFRESLKNRLGDLSGIGEISEAESCRAAIRSLEAAPPDLLVLDFRLGDGTGFDVLEQLKEKLAKTVVIVNTSFPYPQYRERAFALGAQHVLDKSDDAALIDLIQQLTETRPRIRPDRRVSE